MGTVNTTAEIIRGRAATVVEVVPGDEVGVYRGHCHDDQVVQGAVPSRADPERVQRSSGGDPLGTTWKPRAERTDIGYLIRASLSVAVEFVAVAPTLWILRRSGSSRTYPELMRSPFERRGVRLRHHATLVAPAVHPRLASVSVGPLGEATALWTDPDGMAAFGGDDPDVEPQRPEASWTPVSSTVTVHTPERLDTIEIALNTAFPMVQPLPDGQILVVGARAQWRAEGPDHNATIYGPDGSSLLTACVGDGIEHVRTTPSGAIWLAYFDEGVYGNLGWGEPGGPEPMGWPGLVRTNRELEIDWRYPAYELHPIDDCYALNVNREDVWAWIYSSFAVIRVQDSQVRSWSTRAGGGSALVGDGEHVALVGGYNGDHDRLVLGRLDEDFTELRTARLTMPDGAPLPVAATKIGQADELHVFVGPEWFRISLENLGR